MNTQAKNELIDFESVFKVEVAAFEKEFMKAQKKYENAMKRFIKKNITGASDFKNEESEMYGYMANNGSFELEDLLSDVLVYEHMIADRRAFLEDSQYEPEECSED